ncbi:MAG: type IV toxin-antitoxin system AbiEi family antitoxin [Parvularculales bacterium]
MVKPAEIAEFSEKQGPELLDRTLRDIPVIDGISFELESAINGRRYDFLAEVRVGGRKYRLIGEVKRQVHPSQAREAALMLKDYIRHADFDATGVLVSDYLSPASRSICKENGIGYLDLEGNVHLALDGVYLEREVSTKPKAERKKLKSLFKPKSARVLKKMLADPARIWRVAPLAEEAGVSLGHISNIRKSLLEREFARTGKEGLFLCDPDRLLDTWQAEYTPPAGEYLEYYTTHHGRNLTDILIKTMKNIQGRPDMALASFSAADWMASYARYSKTMLYADKKGLNRLADSLDLKSSPSGANVDVVVLKDRDILDESTMQKGGVICTSPIQTYLDLASHGERGKEAADYLREKLMVRYPD